MSTILEALKKAERESGGRLKAALGGPGKDGPRKGLVAGMVILAISVGLWLGYLATGISPPAGGGGEVQVDGPSDVKAPAPPADEVSSVPRPVPAAAPLDPAPLDSARGLPRDRHRGAVLAGEPGAEPSLPQLDLSGVIYDPVHPMAIVNGRFVGVGDSVSGVKILRIQRNSIAISFKGGERTIRLNQ